MKLIRLLPGVLCAVTALAQTPLDETARLQLADGLYSRGMYELAADEYNGFLKAYTNSPKADAAWFRLGECMREQKKPIEAERCYARIANLFPESEYRHKAVFRRAELFLDTGKPETAVKLFAPLLEKGVPPDIASAGLFNLAEAHVQLGQKAEAIAQLERLTRDFGSAPMAGYGWLKLGDLLREAGTEDGRERALECYRQASQRGASDRVRAEGLFQLAALNFELGRFDRSAPAYATLMKTFPGDPRASEARLNAAWAAHNAKLYAEALLQVEAAGSVDARPADEWLYLRGNCERQLSRHEDAVRTYDRLLKEHPESERAAAARFEKALSLFRLARYEEATRVAAEVPLTAENKARVYWLQAEANAALARHDQAVQYYRLIADECPTSDAAAEATYRLAFHLQGKGDRLEAARYYAAVQEKYPQHTLAAKALYAAGQCQALEKQDAEAVRTWSVLIEKYPASEHLEECLYRKSLSEIRLKRDAEALAGLGRLLQQYPKSGFAADARYWRGLLLKEAGEAEAAEAELRRALDLRPREELGLEIRLHLGALFQKKGDHGEAAAMLQPLVSTPVRSRIPPALLVWLASYRFERKEYGQAEAAALLLIEAHEQPAWQQNGWGIIGRCTLAQGQKRKAEEAYEKALAVRAGTPLAAESALRLGEFAFEDRGDARAALSLFEKAAQWAVTEELAGVRARAYVGLGRASKALKDPDGAVRYFMSVAILYDDPDVVPECLYEAWEILSEQGREADAVKALGELRKDYPESAWTRKAAEKLAAKP